MLTPPEKSKQYNIILFPSFVSNRVASRNAARHGIQLDATTTAPWDPERDLRGLESEVTLLDDAACKGFIVIFCFTRFWVTVVESSTSEPSKDAKQANTGELHLCNLSDFPISAVTHNEHSNARLSICTFRKVSPSRASLHCRQNLIKSRKHTRESAI